MNKYIIDEFNVLIGEITKELDDVVEVDKTSYFGKDLFATDFYSIVEVPLPNEEWEVNKRAVLLDGVWVEKIFEEVANE